MFVIDHLQESRSSSRSSSPSVRIDKNRCHISPDDPTGTYTPDTRSSVFAGTHFLGVFFVSTALVRLFGFVCVYVCMRERERESVSLVIFQYSSSSRLADIT